MDAMSRYAGTFDLINYMYGTYGGTITPIGGTLTASNLMLLQDALDQAESAINDYTRRNFVGTVGTKYYNRYSQNNLAGQALYLEDDLVSLSSLTNGDTAVIPVGSVWLEPRNSGPPYRILRLKSGYVYTWNTDSDVIVAGTFGYGTVPPDAIVRSTIRLASYYYRLKDVGPGDVSGQTDAGEVAYPKGIPDDIKINLSPYRSKSGGVV
jgi:hypothetical protein